MGLCRRPVDARSKQVHASCHLGDAKAQAPHVSSSLECGFMCREVTVLYSWIDARSDEVAIDISKSKSKSPIGHVMSSQPPIAPRTGVRR